MKRTIDYYLRQWKDDAYRMPLLLRGARQVGKTYAVRQLGKLFPQFIEINFEAQPTLKSIFEKDLLAERILRDLSLELDKEIVPGKTLLFFDEIQAAPNAIIALRYFYETMPKLHIIAAGSLLDFTSAQVGIPVGRVELLYMFPLSFMEFLAAIDRNLLLREILTHTINKEISETVHNTMLELVGQYMALGGMPRIVECWQQLKKPRKCASLHSSIIHTYRQDFDKYAKKKQIKYIEKVFESIPRQLGEKFKYSQIEGEFRKRELSPALDLLETAALAHKVYQSSCQGFPFGSQIDPFDYKVIFLDVGLSQASLKFNIASWFLNPLSQLINKGGLVEAFIGQEILAYSDPQVKNDLYYWHKERPSQAEIDYVLQAGEYIIPIEVKGGRGKTLKSMHSFLETHSQAPYGIRFSAHNYSLYEKIHSYPLYAVSKVLTLADEEMRNALEELTKSE